MESLVVAVVVAASVMKHCSAVAGVPGRSDLIDLGRGDEPGGTEITRPGATHDLRRLPTPGHHMPVCISFPPGTREGHIDDHIQVFCSRN